MRRPPFVPLALGLAVLAPPAAAQGMEDPVPAVEGKPVYGLSGSWGGVRDSLFERGIALNFSLTFEANRVLSGGLVQHTTGHALYDLNASFDLERIAGWKDAQLSVEAYAVHGHDPSLDVGDYQVFSDYSTDERAQIAQVFYEQWFAERTLRLKLGKLDANSDFGLPGTEVESIHSGKWYSPTTFPMVTYPNPAFGMLAGWVPDEDWSLQLGVYDGATALGVETGGLGPATFFGDPEGNFCIGELARRWRVGARELAGGATLGAWRHTGTFDEFSGGTTNGTGGFYGTLDQEFSHAAEGESGGTQSAFLQLGLADEEVSPVDTHLGLGFRWAGACSARPDDAFGLYVSRVHFSEGAGFSAGAETAYELDYYFSWFDGVALRPDLQLITSPGGDASVDDALVFSLRCELNF
jgi:porin